MKKILTFFAAAVMILSLTACGTLNVKTGAAETKASEKSVAQTEVGETGGTERVGTETAQATGTHQIVLKDTEAELDGSIIEEFDYTWCIDPSKESEWYEGTEPETDAAAYVATDIWYYPELNEDGFTQENYDGETEWVYRYTADGLTDYIFSTLPVLGNGLPTEMMHSSEEAKANKVLHITEPGTYTLQGTWHGQIFVDLGDKDETFTDENAKVTFILDGCDVTCDCAPAFLCYSAFECDNQWEESETHSGVVDTTNAGVKIIIADGSENTFTGANVFRLLKAKYKKEGSTVQKKAHKTDGAFYSFVSMNIEAEEGAGILNVRSTTFEGLDTELHLTINGGNINIYAQDDGINVNEDDVSVFTMNGGTLHIFAGLGAEGDCIDSNGYITINGGIIAGGTPSGADEVLDSDCGNTENGGEIIIIGSSKGMGGGPNGMGQFPGGMGGPELGEEFGGARPERPEGTEGNPPEPPEGFGGVRPEGFGGERPEGFGSELPDDMNNGGAF